MSSTMIAPMVAPMIPTPLLSLKMTRARRPPTIEPTRPRTSVPPMPMGSRPGTSRRASAPAMSPTMSHTMIHMAGSLPRPVHRANSKVQTALQLLAVPTAGAGVLAVAHGTGAGLAADREVALVDERVHRHVVVADVALHVEVGPRRDRVHLDQAAQVAGDDRRLG